MFPISSKAALGLWTSCHSPVRLKKCERTEDGFSEVQLRFVNSAQVE